MCIAEVPVVRDVLMDVPLVLHANANACNEIELHIVHIYGSCTVYTADSSIHGTTCELGKRFNVLRFIDMICRCVHTQELGVCKPGTTRKFHQQEGANVTCSSL